MNFTADKDSYKDLEKKLIEIRRHIHKNPELSLKEYNTSKFIVSKLREFGIEEIQDDIYETTVLATIRGGIEGECILLRADMDALSIEENNNIDFKSSNKGVMHACGHDAHVTWLLGAAYILNLNKEKLKGTFKILFQPAEEGEGGADVLLEHYDLLNTPPKVTKALGAHVWPEIDVLSYGLVNGCAMAAANKFEIDILGKGGHGAEPHKTVDPIALACSVYNSAQQILSRKLSPFSNGVLSIGIFKGEGSFNIIPSKVHLEGTVRAETYEGVCEITNSLEKITKGIVESQGGKYTLKIDKPILPVINDKNLVIEAENICNSIGAPLTVLNHGAMTGEDFCYFSNKVPSLFFYVGTRNEEEGLTYPLHNCNFNIDERILLNTALLLATLASEMS